MEKDKKRKGSGSSNSVVHWSDFQPPSSESTNRLLNSQKMSTHSSHKYFKQYLDSPAHRKMEHSSRMVGIPRTEHRYHPPPEEHPPPVSRVNVGDLIAFFEE